MKQLTNPNAAEHDAQPRITELLQILVCRAGLLLSVVNSGTDFSVS